MKILIAAAALPALLLAGCSNQYWERKDTVTFGVGDAVAWNSAQQIADPDPRRAQNTNIASNGDRGARAVHQYVSGPASASAGGLVTVNVGGGGGGASAGGAN